MKKIHLSIKDIGIFFLILLLSNILISTLYLYTNSISKKCNNLLIKANSKDHRNDFFITTLNLISVIFAENNFSTLLQMYNLSYHPLYYVHH